MQSRSGSVQEPEHDPPPTLLPSSAPPSDASPVDASAQAYHYDLALWITEGSTTKTTTFSLDASPRAAGSVSVGKNVVVSANSRSDVGVRLKGSVVVDEGVPRLDVDATLSFLDASGKVRETSATGNAATPIGSATTLFDKNEGGVGIRLTATPNAAAALETTAPNATGPDVVDVVVTRTGAGVTGAKTSTLTLTITGDTPATANVVETVPLTVADAGAVARPRQDTGARVKASAAKRRRDGLELDFDLELSGVESATAGGTGATIRKIVARGPVIAPFDQPTKSAVVEEDGSRYEVVVTAHPAK